MPTEESANAMLLAPARMTVGAVDDFRLSVISAVADAATAGSAVIAVDLRRTETIDATGLGVLLLLHKRAREAGIKVRLVGPSTSLMDVLKSTRVHLLFEIADAPPAAAFDVGVAEHPSFTEPSRSASPYAEPTVAPVAEAPVGEGSMTEAPPAEALVAHEALPDLVRTSDASPDEIAPISGLVSGYDDLSDEGAPVALPMLDTSGPDTAGTDTAGTDVTIASAQPSPRRCPDCGRDLPAGREVQFCPWCGKNEEGASAPIPTPVPVVAPVPVPVPVAPVVPAPIVAAAPPVPVAVPVRPPRPTRGSAPVPSAAAAPAAPTPIPDASKRRTPMSVPTDDFRALLDATQLYHRIDEDGDARIIFPLESGRTQTAWITRNVDAIGEYAFRYVMSFVADAGELAGNFALMGSLLEQVSAKKGGGLVTRGTMLLYRIPVAVQASPESLAGAVALAAGVADELETAITGEA